MSYNAALAYLDTLQLDNLTPSISFFDRDLSTEQAFKDLLDDLKMLAEAESPDNLKNAAAFFKPFVLHHWQLSRLLDAVRCDIRDKLSINNNADIQSSVQAALILTVILDIVNRDGMSLPWQEESRLGGCDLIKLSDADDLNNPQTYEHTLRNRTGIVQYRQQFYSVKLASAPLWSESTENQPAYNIELLTPSQSETTELARAFGSIKMEGASRQVAAGERSWVEPLIGHSISLNHQQELCDLLDQQCDMSIGAQYFKLYKPKPDTYHSTWSSWIQSIFEGYNHWRLGALRVRRLCFFIGQYLHQEGYALGADWKSNVDWIEAHGSLLLFSSVGVLFFLPRFLRNMGILGYHACGGYGLSPLEAELGTLTRLRAHWMRVWHEVLNDGYWLLSGIAFFTYFYGVVNSQTRALNMVTQIADLLCAIARAAIEIYRFSTLEEQLSPNANHDLATQLHSRIIFEQKVLMYMVFHFLALLVAMCLTLPSAAALSPMLPVIGGICSVIMTIATWKVSNDIRKAREQFNPESLSSMLPKPETTEARIPKSTTVGGTPYVGINHLNVR